MTERYTAMMHSEANASDTCFPLSLSTGKERDTEATNDYFNTRYYASNIAARFLTPDWSKNPEGVPYADFTNPQSLNLYSYMRNNPLSGTDPDGNRRG